MVRYLQGKFRSRNNIAELAEDIVNQAFLDVMQQQNPSKLNFGYLAKAAVHIAYRAFKDGDYRCDRNVPLDHCLEFLEPNDVVDEIMEREDADAVLNSLEVLKAIERIIIVQRYYGDYSFSQIAKANHLKLNTVLSHHRRALEKLRIHLSDCCYPQREMPSVRQIPRHSGFSKFF